MRGTAAQANGGAGDITNVALALAVLDQLGGATKFVDIEEVAVAAFKLAPDRFGWRTKKEYPSWERVRIAFVHANQNEQKRTGGALVIQSKEGTAWKLSALGVEFVRENAARTEKATGRRRPASSAASASGRRVKEIRRHSAFSRFTHGTPVAEIERFELADLLMCPPDSSMVAVERKVDAARAAAVDAGDELVARFLGEVAKEVGRKWS